MEANDGRQAQGAYIPQELLKEISKVNNRLLIGIPRERCEAEKRLPLTPEAVDMLTDCGHRVLVESGAGLGINYSDNHFSEAGAEIVDTPAEVFQADLILKILPPLPVEIALMRPRTTVFSLVQFNLFAQEAFELMMAKRITAISYELMADEYNRFPVLNVTSEIEGAASITIASELLSNTQGGKGILLGGIPGVSPTEVVIIGAGNVGASAAYALLNQNICEELILVDLNTSRAEAHAQDLSDAAAKEYAEALKDEAPAEEETVVFATSADSAAPVAEPEPEPEPAEPTTADLYARRPRKRKAVVDQLARELEAEDDAAAADASKGGDE